jgi:hypothetical protein
LLLLLRRIGSIKPSAAAFIRLAIFLHDFKEFLQRLRLDSIKQSWQFPTLRPPTMASMMLPSDTSGARAVSLTTLCMYSCSDSLSP